MYSTTLSNIICIVKLLYSEYLECSESVVLTGKYRTEREVWFRWQANNIIDLVRADVVIGLLAVYIVVIHIAPTHKQVTPFNTPRTQNRDQEVLSHLYNL